MDDKLLQLDAIWTRTEAQLHVIKRVSKILNDEQRRVQDALLKRLSSTLQETLDKLESTLSQKADAKPRPLKYAWNKALDDMIAGLEQWQRLYDPTWFLITLISDRIIDTEVDDVRKTFLPAPSTADKPAPAARSLSTLSQLRRALYGSEKEVHVTLPSRDFDSSKTTPVPYTDGSIRTFLRTSTSTTASEGTARWMLVDSIVLDPPRHDLAAARKDAEDLARTLKAVDPETFGLLRCHGIVKEKSTQTGRLAAIHLVFRPPSCWVPPSTSIAPEKSSTSLPSLCTLREALLRSEREMSSGRHIPNQGQAPWRKTGACPPSLTARLEIAQSLASSVSFVHVCNLVHKNIRPESTVLFQSPEKGDEQGVTRDGPAWRHRVFLLGFDGFRREHYQTLRVGDTSFERNLYRHSSRQGPIANENYVMQHDIYSLGVCLLEIGLWRSLVKYERSKDGEGGDENVELAQPSELLGLDLEKLDMVTWPQKTRAVIKDTLLALAREELPAAMGDRYTSVVVACLTCLDEDSADFANDGARDEDGLIVGVRFIESVLMKLGEIVL